MIDKALRGAAALTLLALASAFGAYAVMIGSRIFADYKDNSDTAYLLVAGVAGTVALCLVGLSLSLLHRGGGRLLLLATGAVAVTLLSALTAVHATVVLPLALACVLLYVFWSVLHPQRG